MAPKKKEVQKLSYGEFMTNDNYGGSWADEVEETYESGTQPLPPQDRRFQGSSSSYGNDRGYSRDPGPQRIPDKPPYLAHLGNLDYEVKTDDLNELLEGCEVTSIRLIEDRDLKRPKGFGYAEFASVDGLKKALAMDGISFQRRNIKIKLADPPKDRDRGDSTRDFSDWSRKGPLPDLPSRGSDRRAGPSDFSERRPPRDGPIDEKLRDFGNWERKGPLSPIPQQERPTAPGPRDGSRPRTNDGHSESVMGNRRASPAAWGEGRQEGPRPPRRDGPERPERVPSAAERDMQWRTSMRPDAPAKSPAQSRSGSEAPPSPAPAVAVPATRPKLNLTKRTVAEAPELASPALTSAGDFKASPFGAARPIDTAAREREVEEKRLAAMKEKKEADDKVKEERRIAKEAATLEASTTKPAEETTKLNGDGTEEIEEGVADEMGAHDAKSEAGDIANSPRNGNTDDVKAPLQPREPKEEIDSNKTKASDSGNWRHASNSGEHRGGRRPVPSGPRRGTPVPPRGPRHEGPRPARANGSSAPPVHQSQPPQPDDGESVPPGPDEEGWEKVPNKGRRNQRPRPTA